MSDPTLIPTLADAATLPAGFRAAGVACGIKPTGLDLALFVSDRPAEAAGVFTTNRVQAAPVRLGRQRLAAGTPARAIVINSGNANACTGEPGRHDAQRMATLAAQPLGAPPEQVFMCSTGPIGIPLPMDRIEAGIAAAAAALSPEGGDDAARAIMTTDTVPKQGTLSLSIDGTPIRMTGIAKGSGMIHPNMATMLCVVLTDAAVVRDALQAALADAVRDSFNRISVDGDRSTNDTVLVLANGAAGGPVLGEQHPAWPAFRDALRALTQKLALNMVADGEGATRCVTLRVTGAASDADADRVARAVGNSLLIKTSWAGGDPNWGRILCAVGYSGVDIDESAVDIRYDDLPAAAGGLDAGTPVDALRTVAARDAFTITIALHAGDGTAVLYACDTTEAYVRINVEE